MYELVKTRVENEGHDPFEHNVDADGLSVLHIPEESEQPWNGDETEQLSDGEAVPLLNSGRMESLRAEFPASDFTPSASPRQPPIAFASTPLPAHCVGAGIAAAQPTGMD